MSVLSTGTGALIAFQRALATVSHNVANLNTPGYSRQRADFAARTPTDYGYGYVGNGTRLAQVGRVADQMAISRLLDSGGELARLQQLSSLAGRVDSLFSDKATNLAGLWSNFFDSVSALSSNASSSAERENLLAQASAMANRFRVLDGQLGALGQEVNNGLITGAAEINRLSAEVARLNGMIGSDATRAAPDLLDRRDQLISELVAYTGGTAVSQDGGPLNVFTAGGQALVVGTIATQVATVADPYRPERLQLALLTPGQPITLDGRSMGGRIGGLLEFRASVLDPSMAELGRIASGLVDTFNAAHRAGMDLYGQMGGDFFALPAPAVNPHQGNGSGATLQASFHDLGQVDGQNLLLRFEGGGWVAQRVDTGASVPVAGSGAPGDPLRVNGIAIVVAGTPASGDRFLLQPTAGVAGGISVAITDPSRIAAATPVKARADIGNLGTGIPGKVTVTDASDAALLVPARIEFLDAGQYTVDGAGPFAYTPGQSISANGWSLVLDGMPAAGDFFEVVPTGPGSSDNGNATRLANLDDARVLSGGTVTLNGAIGGLTTAIGSAARQAGYSAEAQQVLHDQAQSARDAISGVNLDEEAANMLRLQQAYQAAAQIIATADTMFQSILNAARR
ncbi:flagellar hook-associated protein FlgK [Pseudoxanthomonas suwonensis]|uniref:Flagellar hook-associated protein 1 n=1 Tax=Pseudoxanthomonas suwonensis TaxID=314722 RepID=A0A0E3UPE8_9GAMM|nr:flagellar hook-associated protein FlgK [Pseudoxanthomonas suwonensis]AKC87996.1 flagellar hook protein FlgK [Pseudoxanthomonas suwonensis]